MNKVDMERLEYNISHNMKYVETTFSLLKCLDVILPSGDDYTVITRKGEVFLSQEDIFIIKTAIRCSMEETAAWVEQKTKELEELKNGKEKQN